MDFSNLLSNGLYQKLGYTYIHLIKRMDHMYWWIWVKSIWVSFLFYFYNIFVGNIWNYAKIKSYKNKVQTPV